MVEAIEVEHIKSTAKMQISQSYRVLFTIVHPMVKEKRHTACIYFMVTTKSNHTNCSAAGGGANCLGGMQTNSIRLLIENRVESCSITSWGGTGWEIVLDNMPSDAKFLFTKCKCIANTGGDAAGAITSNYPPAVTSL
ncbi:uncharacterized protein MONOS_10982 [Monocercomonoides exilis]|uniref:uncharacterized protein n=1 Tax=Monocercomonoides exilis TaxID=2049356 RepID=UPI003559DBB9|nr:hypothetical protein MONOS_10982 [Monocercomonoides exilis]|eukprot:MONOS_10982.1-p1 / transcript=MONOS_10982.1 / gene=MONOS_10982 / organism=Monocercomonoides_exilis_PA203 / gene_product=unspecified product / transcript_product=unspecified product / location=Mono_scaffold00525:3823-4236(-) / protein_length=138 / sequence_SO=supercontig / SO=protein_coding / is_pseudo=false